jgi:small redox-active disulfide protein 2
MRIARRYSKMEIKVLGPGCPKCQTLEKNTKDAVAELGLDAQVGKVTDINEITNYGVFMTPGLVVDGEVKIVGKVASKDEIKKILSK